ncbi:D-alanine--D-alanine ligase [Agaribacter marinus]|uniref:D-alanine--D-alanine ligase n=1 Tax=Agaribacter marinus TaxID=1431249 RepID=A0AA37SWI1_9ALTE|nr:D-alanine--D-alanine ligase [Agaribacter marinus]GLR71061.1 D-alanine--D-alanine ligase [Agaribacter marinus]
MLLGKYSPESFGKVAVLLGGESAEREVSLASGSAVLKTLHDAGIDAHGFDPAHRSIHELISESFDRAFIMLHGRGGEDGVIQGALQQLKIRYTGTGVLGSALAMDKVLSKLVWSARNMPTADYRVLEKATFNADECALILADLGGTVMVKPSREGSSIGMAKANEPKVLQKAIETAFTFDDDVLVEAYIDGPEYTVAIVNGKALPSIRMTSPHDFYDYDAKYGSNTTEYFCPSGLPAAQEQELSRLALTAFEMLSGAGWGRVDLMRDKHGKFYLLESNTAPGMTETSLVPKAAKQAGMSFQDLVVRILSQTLSEN